MRFLMLLIAALTLTGCATQGDTFNQTVLTDPAGHLSRGRAVHIATPKNGWFENTEYPGSGRMVASNLRAAFARFSDHVAIADTCTDLACLKRSLPASQTAYYVVPEILHWESRGKHWSTRPEVIEVKISVFESDQTQSRASAILSIQHKNALFGSEHPQDTLQDPINRYVSSLY